MQTERDYEKVGAYFFFFFFFFHFFDSKSIRMLIIIQIPSNQHTDCEIKTQSISQQFLFHTYLSARKFIRFKYRKKQQRKNADTPQTLIDYHCCFCCGWFDYTELFHAFSFSSHFVFFIIIQLCYKKSFTYSI